MKPNTQTCKEATMNSRPIILLVGGTDPSGGAGLAADIKSCSALGGHGCICVTATTVQNFGKVKSWEPVNQNSIKEQMEVTIEDGLPAAIKTGMLGSANTVKTVAEVIRTKLNSIPFVLDPVMVAGSGDNLADESIEESVIKYLLPLATLVTPNLDEAEAFTGKRVRNKFEMEAAAKEIQQMGAENVLLKGGHLEGAPSDVLVTKDELIWFPGERIVPGKVHGTGCTLASSCATLLGAGYPPKESVTQALAYLRGAITASFERKLGTLIGHFPGMGSIPKEPNRSSFYSTPKFCPACGGELIKSLPHPICSRCGLIFYRNPLPAVILVLQKDNKIMLARRAMAPAKGELGLPGGFIDLHETPMEAAARELEEETSLTGATFELIGADQDHTDYGSVVLYIYSVKDWNGQPEAADDVSEILWRDLDKVYNLAFRAHDRVIELLKKERGL